MENNKTNSSFKIISSIVVLIVIILALVFFMPKTKDVVAEVNGEKITQDELNKKIEKTKNFLKGNGNTEVLTAEQEKELQKNVLESIITEKLLATYNTENNISVSTEELDTEFANIVTQAGGEAGLEAEIKKFNTSKEQLREDIRSTLMFRKAIEKYIGAEKLTVTEEEALNAYNTLVAEAKAQTTPPTEPITPFAEAKVFIMEQLKNQKIGTASQGFVEFLRGKATIKTFLE